MLLWSKYLFPYIQINQLKNALLNIKQCVINADGDVAYQSPSLVLKINVWNKNNFVLNRSNLYLLIMSMPYAESYFCL